MVKVFSQDKILCFIDSQKLYVADVDSVLVSIQSQDEMRLLYDELVNKNNLTKIYFYNKDEKVLFSYFTSLFKKIGHTNDLAQLGVHRALVASRALTQLLLQIVVQIAKHDVSHETHLQNMK